MRNYLALVILLFGFTVKAQYQFSGYVNLEEGSPDVYLSVVNDYRKISGLYNEQILSKTSPDSLGYFEFKGNQLETSNRIYKIHTDSCNDEEDSSHFNGQCRHTYQVLFIAKNTDTLNLPYGFDKQIFCDIQSNNPNAINLIKIDSLKEEMKFAYSDYRSLANRQLNNKKWFTTLQEFSKNSGDPLAELYTYAFLSNRANDFYSYYTEDLKTNPYYKNLQERLETQYPEANYTQQYQKELTADLYMIQPPDSSTGVWEIVVYLFLGISLVLNALFLYQRFQQKSNKIKRLKAQLSKQELVVLDLLLHDKTNKDIAEQLYLSVSTVKSHTNAIYKKLNVQSRTEVKALFTR